MARITKSTEYIRHTFSQDERLTMGSDLAAAHNSMSAIEEEEAYIRAQLKERKASVEQTIGRLSRDLGSGFTMQNVPCKWVYDAPNVGEVQYVREDTGEVVKTRPMSQAELQQEIDFDKPVAAPPPTLSVEESEENAEGFFEEEAEVEISATFTQAGVEHARQSLVTMGDAKKGRKKAPEANA